MTERWLPVVGYEGLYEVSDVGRVASTRRKGSAGGLMTPQLSTSRYWRVSLYRDGKYRFRYVHHLVMEAFVGPRPAGLEVRHLDGNAQNASLANLAYGTSAENKRDQIRHGTQYFTNKTHCPSGHPYDEANTYILPSRPNARYCRTCRNRPRVNRSRARKQ